MLASLFTKIHVDMMHLLKLNGYKYFVQGWCSIWHYNEFHKLWTETAVTLGDWMFEDILCRWGTIFEIVIDNGLAFIKALKYLAKKYYIHHIHISSYNSHTNKMVERSHFDVRQALYKSVDGVQSQWSKGVYLAFLADWVTIHHRMGCSPYFAVTSTHPILPLDTWHCLTCCLRQQTSSYHIPSHFRNIRHTSPHHIQKLWQPEFKQQSDLSENTLWRSISLCETCPIFRWFLQFYLMC
jgi:hypothetical protein